jgi:hypothetical protein
MHSDMSRLFLSRGLLEQADQSVQRAIASVQQMGAHSPTDIKSSRDLAAEISRAKAALTAL